MRSNVKYIDWTAFSSLIARAMAQGGELEFQRCYWNCAPGCSKPYRVTLCSHPPDAAYTAVQRVDVAKQRWLDIDTQCRKCPSCLKARQRLWINRMKFEINQSNRTWFCTYTINPHHRFLFSLEADTRDYLQTYKVISKEFTKYLKRVRKAGYKFKFVMVAEAHKDNYPHLHAFVHEVSSPIPKRVLEGKWPFGFTKIKLVDANQSNAAYYAAKYLAKDARTRIRASQKYGQSVRDLSFDNKLPKAIGYPQGIFRDTQTPTPGPRFWAWLNEERQRLRNVDQNHFPKTSEDLEWPEDPYAIPFPDISRETFSRE